MILWIVLAIVILIIFSAIRSQGNKTAAESEKILQSWGKFQQKKYPRDDFENISHYAKMCAEEGFYIDDITWNDLEMDRIFQVMDNTRSSIGREYLYKALRMPELEKAHTVAMGEAVSWFSDEKIKDKRIKLQLILSKLGFVRNFSFSDYIDAIQELHSVGSAISIILDIILAASIIFTVTVNAPIGILCVAAVVLTATAVYFKKKPAIEPFFICLSQVSRMVRTGKTLMGQSSLFDGAPDALIERIRGMEGYICELEPCIKGDWLIADSRSTGSPAEVFMNYIRMFTHVDIIHYNRAISRMQGHKDAIMGLMRDFGYIELAVCASSFREALPVWSIPEFIENGSDEEKALSVLELYHPLIDEAVPNSIIAPSDQGDNVLITGSNASGKSTFLKSAAINAILSQSVATSVSKGYNAPMYRIYSSMSLRDDLKTKGSYYMVEIKSLKRIMDAAKLEGAPVLCFVDEVLRGTNTIERIAASSAILKKLGAANSLVFAATHDIELTSLLENEYANYHFREEMTDEGIEFSYILYDGPATTRNAIALLDNLGYDKDIIQEARQRADTFTNTGVWK